MPSPRIARRLSGMAIGLAGRPLDALADEDSIESDLNESQFLSREQEAISIDEAIISLARAVFSRAGTMVFEDHPLLTPLLETIALQYWQAPPLEPRTKEPAELANPGLLVVGQPRSEENWLTPVPRLMSYTPEIPSEFDAIVFVASRPEDYERWIARRARRKYVISSTSRIVGESKVAQDFIDLDEELWQTIQNRRSEVSFEPRFKERDVREAPPQEFPELRYAAYPLLMPQWSPQNRP